MSAVSPHSFTIKGNVLFRLFKKRLLKWLLKDASLRSSISIEQFSTDSKFETANIAGLGGQSFNPAFISWNHLFQQAYAELRQYQDKPQIIREYLFFAYFGPLESWCDRNCQSKFLLWPTEHGIYRYFADPVDVMLWNLTWDKPMPTIKELEQAR